jgi:Protein of unknown function (DUF1573)
MKKSLTALAAAFVVLLAAFGVYSLVIKGAPQIKVTPAFMDLGDVTKEGFNYTFTVSNTGSKELVINRVSTSCGCVLATIESEVIMPDEETGLFVTYNPKLMGEVVKGKVKKIIFIKSNDPEMPEIEIKLTANVVEG